MPALPQYDPLAVPATYQQINDKWLALEAAPVTVGDHTVDFNERSEKRMADTVDQWDSLPEIPGVVEVAGFGGAKTVKWRMADNSVVTFSHIELTEFLSAARAARAARAAVLFAAVQALKSSPATTVRDIETPENWGL